MDTFGVCCHRSPPRGVWAMGGCWAPRCLRRARRDGEERCKEGGECENILKSHHALQKIHPGKARVWTQIN